MSAWPIISVVISSGVGVGRLEHVDQLAVAQHRDPVAHLEHLIQPVRDEDDAGAGFLLPAHQVEDVVEMLLAGRRGGLVQDHDLVRGDLGAGQGQHLPLPGTEITGELFSAQLT